MPLDHALRPITGLLLALGLLLLSPGLAGFALAETPSGPQSCDGSGLCRVMKDGARLGEYRFRPPSTGKAAQPGPKPAVLFIHGWRDSSGNVMRMGALRRFADEIGAVLIAPQGIKTTWSYPGSPIQERDEFVYFSALRRAIVDRHDVDPKRILVAGFSMGASMAWNLACDHGANYWGFVTFSGAFWSPLPKRCANPARRLIHIHGEADRTVPIEGRPIGSSWRQGDAHESMKILLAGSAFKEARKQPARLAGMDCQSWSNSGALLQFCRHKGGHFWRAPWLKAAYAALLAR